MTSISKKRERLKKLKEKKRLERKRLREEQRLRPVSIFKNGEAHINAKLKNENVIDIYLNKKNLTGIELSKKYGVSTNVISDIKNDKIWLSVTKDLSREV